MNKLLCFATLLLLSISAHAQANLDSLWSVWNDPSQADTTRSQAMNEVIVKSALNWSGVVAREQGNKAEALEYFEQALEIFEEKGDKEDIANALRNIGRTYQYLGNFTLALDYYARSLKICQEIGAKKSMLNPLLFSGTLYREQGDYAKAMEYYTRHLKISEEIGDKVGMANGLNDIGIIQINLGNYTQALDYYTRSLKIREEIGSKSNIAGSLINIGIIYLKQGDLSQALDYLRKGAKIAEETGEKPFLVNALNSIGTIYLNQQENTKALEIYQRMLKISNEIGYKVGITFSQSNISEIYNRQGNYRMSISYGTNAIKVAHELGYPRPIQQAAEILVKSYRSTGQYQQALEKQTLVIQMSDSLESEENQKAAIQHQYQYQYEKKALTDSLEYVEQQLKQDLAHQTIMHQKDQNRNMLIAGVLIVFILALGLWFRSRYIQQTNKQLAEAKERAERSEQYKEQFLANMSHEIRTPMHAISGMVKILERNEHAAEQDVYLDAMHQSSDNLLVILNDILDLSKIEAGKLDMEIMPIQPAAVIENVSKILTFKAAEKGLHLHINIAPDVPKFVMGDPTRLNQILTNLAGNAIKFTSTGSVSISVKRKNEFLIYEVRDSGIGIPEDKLQNIFEAFEQGSSSITQTYGGTGLGLNISQQLVELQGGNIWAESVAGTGSTFFVSLPLIPVKDEAIHKISLTEEQVQSMATALKGTRILLAEDNAFNQMIVQDDLQFYVQDIDIQVVENGATAFEAFQTGDYDLILMDVQMPEMDGYQATINIREWEQANNWPHIPIIAMTASLLKSEVNLCFEVGMDNYIPKPYRVDELISPIYTCMGKASSLIT